MIVDQSILDILSRASMQGPALTLVGQLDRKSYEAVNKVLTAAGGKWDKRAKAHLFDGDAAEAIDYILLTGTVQRVKQDFGQFDSPAAVVDRVINLAGNLRGKWVLEPSAGIGNLAIAAKRAGASLIEAYEIDEKRGAALCSNLSDGGATVWITDFLTTDPGPEPGFDVVVMNPPFARQADIAHVMHAASFLRPSGILVSVMSSGVRFREDRKTKEFRDFLADHGGEMHDLPDGSFKESGTMVNSLIVRLSQHA